MKFIGITQRVDVISSYQERRDSLDQAWKEVCHSLNAIMVPLANDSTHIEELLMRLNLDLVIFSGGNSLGFLNDDESDFAPERDRFEKELLDYALRNNIPVLGVCRGMQFINHFFGGQLHKVTGHVATNHPVSFCCDSEIQLPETVNSFHNWGIGENGLSKELKALAVDDTGNIEAFIHTQLPILGIMWHPERNLSKCEATLKLIKRYLF